MKVQEISSSEAKEWLETKQAILLDVREENERLLKNINGSIMNPLSTFSSESISKIDYIRNKKIVVYCESGFRSFNACLILLRNGFEEVYNMSGGISDWIEKGFDISTNNKHQS